jgi:hypothetical protein
MRALPPEKVSDSIDRWKTCGIDREALIAEPKNGVNTPSWKSSLIFGALWSS